MITNKRLQLFVAKRRMWPFAKNATIQHCHTLVFGIFSDESNWIYLILLRLLKVEVPTAISCKAWWLKS